MKEYGFGFSEQGSPRVSVAVNVMDDRVDLGFYDYSKGKGMCLSLGGDEYISFCDNLVKIQRDYR